MQFDDIELDRLFSKAVEPPPPPSTGSTNTKRRKRGSSFSAASTPSSMGELTSVDMDDILDRNVKRKRSMLEMRDLEHDRSYVDANAAISRAHSLLRRGTRAEDLDLPTLFLTKTKAIQSGTGEVIDVLSTAQVNHRRHVISSRKDLEYVKLAIEERTNEPAPIKTAGMDVVYNRSRTNERTINQNAIKDTFQDTFKKALLQMANDMIEKKSTDVPSAFLAPKNTTAKEQGSTVPEGEFKYDQYVPEAVPVRRKKRKKPESDTVAVGPGNNKSLFQPRMQGEAYVSSTTKRFKPVNNDLTSEDIIDLAIESTIEDAKMALGLKQVSHTEATVEPTAHSKIVSSEETELVDMRLLENLRELYSNFVSLFDNFKLSSVGHKVIVPKRRPIDWLLKLIEDIYDARYSYEFRNKVQSLAKKKTEDRNRTVKIKPVVAKPLPVSTPAFTIDHLTKAFGLKQIFHQTAADITWNIELYRKEYKEVDTFGLFLSEMYSEDELMVYLLGRQYIEQEYGVSFKKKDKMTEESYQKRTGWIQIKPHPLLHDGTHIVNLSRAACSHICKKILDDASMASYIVNNIWTLREHQLGDVSKDADESKSLNTKSKKGNMVYAFADSFLKELTEEYRDCPHEVMEEMNERSKAKGEENNLDMIELLKDAMVNDIYRERLATRILYQEREVAAARLKLIQIEALHSQDGAIKADVFIAKSELVKAEGALRETVMELKGSESADAAVWNQAMQRAEKIVTMEAKFDSDLINYVIDRFKSSAKCRLQKHHTQLEVLDQIKKSLNREELLKQACAIRIQRAFRGRREARIAKAETERIIEERKLEKQQRKERLQQQKEREEEMVKKNIEEAEKHKNRMAEKKRKADAAIEEREKKRGELLVVHREKEANKRFLRKNKECMEHYYGKWKIYRELCLHKTKARIMRQRKFFQTWIRSAKVMKSEASAATKIQSLFRGKKARDESVKLIRKENLNNSKALSMMARLQDKFVAVCFFDWKLSAQQNHKVKIMAARAFGHVTQRMFIEWQEFVKERHWAATKIQKVAKGRKARKNRRAMQKRLDDQLHAAVKLQRVYRGRRCRKKCKLIRTAAKQREAAVHLFMSSTNERHFRKVFDTWHVFSSKRANAKRYLEAKFGKLEKYVFSKWKGYTRLQRARKLVAIRSIQKHWRLHMEHVLNRKTAAAIKIQKTYRGYLARKYCKYLRKQLDSAIKIQSLVRGYWVRREVKKTKLKLILSKIWAKDFDYVKFLFSRGYATLTDPDGNSILTIAALAGSKRIVKLALTHGLEMSHKNYYGKTVVHLMAASKAQNTQLLDYMCMHGASVNSRDYQGKTPLMEAAKANNPEMIEFLLKSYTDHDARDVKGFSALHISVTYRNTDCLKKLAEAGANVTTRDKEGVTPLHDCAVHDWKEQATWLLYYGADINATDSDGSTPLIYAIANGRVDMAKCLISSPGADLNVVNKINGAPLHYCAELGAEEITDTLLEAGALPDCLDNENETPVHVCIRRDHLSVCRKLLQAAATVDYPNGDGDGPLHIACMLGKLNFVKLLFQYGGDINKRNFKEETPLGEAVLNRRFEIVEYLNKRFEKEMHQDYLKDEPVVVHEDFDWFMEWDEYGQVQFRNLVTGVVTDKKPPKMSNLWKRLWDEGQQREYFYNIRTGKQQWEAPTLVKAPLQKEAFFAEKIYEGAEWQNTLGVGKDDYTKFRTEIRFEVSQLKKEIEAATLIQRTFRMVIAKRRYKKFRRKLRATRKIQAYFRMTVVNKRVKREKLMNHAATTIQAHYRGRKMRRELYEPLRQNRAARNIQRVWKGSLARRKRVYLKCKAKKPPMKLEDWYAFWKLAQKTVCSHFTCDEYQINSKFGLKFYYDNVKITYSLDKSPEWVAWDLNEARKAKQMKYRGYTDEMWAAAVKLQSSFRKRLARVLLNNIRKGIHIMTHAEEEHYNDPADVVKMCNYALYALSMKRDNLIARRLWSILYTNMVKRGPDNAFTLYGYSLYLTVTGEGDWDEIYDLVIRARKADRNGRSFRLAILGFFRQAMIMDPKEAETHLRYALSVAYNARHSYATAEAHLIKAIQLEPHNRDLERCYNFILTRLMGATYLAGEAFAKFQRKEAAEYEIKWLKTQYYWNFVFMTSVLKKYMKYYLVRKNIKRPPKVEVVKKKKKKKEVWEENIDPNSGLQFYYNPETGESRWDNPSPVVPRRVSYDTTRLKGRKTKEVEDVEARVLSMLEAKKNVLSPEAFNDLKSQIYQTLFKEETSKEATEWEECEDIESGSKYWYNSSTGESSWTKPVILDALDLAVENRGDWEEIVDEENRVYWFCKSSGMTQWEAPYFG